MSALNRPAANANRQASSIETYRGNHALLSQAFVRPFDLEAV